MIRVHVDPAALAVPNYAVSGEEVDQIIDTISNLSDLSLANIPVDAVLDDMIEDILWSSNVGPDRENIGQFLELVGISHIYSANDLLQLYNTILSRFLRSSDLEAPEVVTFRNFVTSPTLPPMVPACLADETERSFATVAFRSSGEGQWFVGASFATDVDIWNVEVAVDSVSGGQFDLPIDLNTEVPLFRGTDDLINFTCAEVVWNSARDASDIAFAIAIEAMALARQINRGEAHNRIPKFFVGADFWPSLVRNGDAGTSVYGNVIRRTCAAVLLGVPGASPKPFGKPHQETREIDNACAWRCHIGKAAQALRLMYWRKTDGLEFANVGVKKEEEISHCQPRAPTCIDLGPAFPPFP